MDGLVAGFVAAIMTEWGDRTQLIAAMLAARFGRVGPVVAGLALAALLSSAVAAVAGAAVAALIAPRAALLMVALSLLFAGATGFIPRKAPAAESKAGPFLSAFLLCLAAEFVDRSQFVTFALATRFDPAFVAAGAAAGIAAAAVPAALLGRRFAGAARIWPARYGIAALFLLAGFLTAISALRLA